MASARSERRSSAGFAVRGAPFTSRRGSAVSVTILTEDDLAEIGVGGVEGAALRAAGIESRAALLEACASPDARDALGATTGIEAHRLLRWTLLADLLRVPELEPEQAAMLLDAGVLGTAALAQCRALALWKWLFRLYGRRQRRKDAPDPSAVRGWVRAARRLPILLHD